MTGVRVFACFATVLLLGACATQPDVPQVQFVNDSFGIASDFTDEWVIFTDRESAPTEVKAQFPANKSPDDSPLLLGSRVTGDAWVRLLVQDVPSEWTTADYFNYVYSELSDQVAVYDARVSPNHDVVRWTYQDKNVEMDLTYVETIFVRNGSGLRLGYWTITPLLPIHQQEFDRLSDAWLFRDGEGTKWENDWLGLTKRLSTEGLELVALSPFPSDEDSCAEGERQKMWDLVGPEGRVHLFGSIHFGRPGYYPLPDVIESAFERSQSLSVEVDATDPEIAKRLQELMLEYGTLPPGQSIVDQMSSGAYARLAEAFDKMGLPIDRFHGLKAWSLATLVSVFKLQSLGYLQDYGVDKYFLDRAGDREVMSIESAEDQIRLLSSMDGELYLGFTLLGLDMMDEQSDLMMGSWQCGDEAEMTKLFIDTPAFSIPGSDELMEKMYYERNVLMADFAVSRLETPGEHFLVVGTAHLIGDRGVPALLRERGYTVESR